MTVWIHVDTSKQASRLALKVKSAPSLQVYRTGR